MNLKQIRFALAVAQEQNFTRAAKRCHTVQSALSHQIARLEEELGSQLFERTSRQVQLTAAGRAFLAPAEQLLAAHNHLLDTMEALKGEIGGTLTVGTISTLKTIDLVGQLARFNQRYPLVNIRLYVAMSEKLLEDVQQSRTDVAFVGLWPGDRATLSMPYKLLTDEPLVALVSHDHPFAGRERLRLSELAQVPLVDFYQGSGARRQTDKAFLTEGVRRHVSFEIDHIEWLENIVRTSLAAGIVPLSTAEQARGLVSIPLESGIRRQVFCVWQHSLSTVAERFMAFSQEEFRAFP
jgi:DNA-binding transcriptional LysR family regulator